ncbi:hypothetical protein [uncultured Methylobacterium sp.]|uniref:hypothetical protein n=1 Tax=uncultured Methylobacterium sp. TaxID=157278 RepID=UPI0035CB248D
MNASTLVRLRTRILACALAATVTVLPPVAAFAQEIPRIDARRGAFLIHGNFCGPGNRGPGHPPIDALDLACARHDACTPDRASGRLPHCACNDRLRVEAGRVARDPGTPRSVRETARFIADGADALPCAD